MAYLIKFSLRMEIDINHKQNTLNITNVIKKLDF